MKLYLKKIFEFIWLMLPIFLCVLIFFLFYFAPALSPYMDMDPSVSMNDDITFGFFLGLFTWFFSWMIKNLLWCLFGKEGLLRFRSRSSESSS